MELDNSEFEILFKANYAPLCLTAIRILGDKTIAEDIVQEVFLQLWKKRETLNIESSLKSYLHKAVINQSLNYHAKEKALLKREEIHFNEVNEDINTTEQKIFLSESQNKVDTVINSLPEGCRRIFILSRFEYMTYKQIAERLNISVKTVENQMMKALKILRTHLSSFIFLIFLFRT